MFLTDLISRTGLGAVAVRRGEAVRAAAGAVRALAALCFIGAGLVAGAAIGPARADGYVPTIDRYNVEGALGGFVLDRVSYPARMKFDWSSEIFVLRETPGPRGDTFYKADTGQNILNETSTGGLILYTKRYPRGVPANWIGAGEPLKRPEISQFEAFVHIRRVEKRLSDMLGKPLPIAIDWARARDSLAYRINAADTAQVTGAALIDLAGDQELRKRLRAEVDKVNVIDGDTPGVGLQNRVLTGRFRLKDGLLGRYSSYRTAAAVQHLL